MRIGCLQFAPVQGEMDHNLSRADAVLCKANPDGLDLLVLPELAFAGHGYRNIDEIYPYLEPTCAGVTALWARTAALRFDCTVVAGYAERVKSRSVSSRLPEYYNSAIMVNSDGETIANYRKSHLQASEESWARESQHGFYEDWVPGVGQVALGISMDINPYRFEEPWETFDFAFHIMEIDANVVIITMSWPTHEDKRAFSRLPLEPDTNTLMFWISRLEPLITAEKQDEVIVIFCNRCGVDGDTCFSGTSTVLGIIEGEVRVYGLLGRSNKELLVVDTNNTPFGRLVYRPDSDAVKERAAQAQAFMEESYRPVKPGANVVSTGTETRSILDTLNVEVPAFDQIMQQKMDNLDKHPRSDKVTFKPKERNTVLVPPRKPPTPLALKNQPRQTRQLANIPPSLPTPSAPSPTPMGVRPRFTIPPMESITQRYVDSQREHHYGRTGFVLMPNSEIPMSPMTVEGQVDVNIESTTAGSTSDFSMSTSRHRWPDLFPLMTVPPFQRSPSAKSEGTLFSDWVDSEYSQPMRIDGSIRVMSGTNTRPRDRDNSSTVAHLNARLRSNSGAATFGRGANDPDTPVSPSEPPILQPRRFRGNSTSAAIPKIERGSSVAAEEYHQFPKTSEPKGSPGSNRRGGQTPRQHHVIPEKPWSSNMRDNDSGFDASGGRQGHETKREWGNNGTGRYDGIGQVSKDHGSRSSSQTKETRGRRSTRTNGKNEVGNHLTTLSQCRRSNRKRSTSRKVDLSQFRLVEEYPSLDCPIHGQAAQQRAASQDRVDFDGKHSKSRSYSTGMMGGSPLPGARAVSRDKSNKTRSNRRPSSRNKRLALVGFESFGTPTPNLTNQVLARHQTSSVPWVETWMPPNSRTVPPSSLVPKPDIQETRQTSKPYGSGRVTPRAMVLINDPTANGVGGNGEPVFKCIERSASAMDPVMTVSGH